MEPEIVADYACETGEGPLWHTGERRLYWADIPKGRLFCYDPATGTHAQIYEGEPVGGFTVQADGALLLFLTQGAVRTWRHGVGFEQTIMPDIEAERASRYNDAVADPRGRVFAGTMPPDRDHPSRLYRFNTKGVPTLLFDDLGLSNGMGFSPDQTRFYHTDTRKGYAIHVFDFDGATGELSNRRRFAHVADADVETEGRPDGLTVDAEGRVWSARFGGGCLVCYDPDGTEVDRVPLPGARNVTSVAFGGENLADLYVTTAGGGDREKNGENAGALFRLRIPSVRGLPEFVSRVGLLAGKV